MKPLPIGLVTKRGTIKAVGCIRGERFYLLTDRDDVVARCSADELEGDAEIMEAIDRMRADPWTGHIQPVLPPGMIEYGPPE